MSITAIQLLMDDGTVRNVSREEAAEALGFLTMRSDCAADYTRGRSDGYDAALHERFPSQCGHSLIALERSRQQLVEGFSDERDDAYVFGELAHAAACYLMRDVNGGASPGWPHTWDSSWWKPGTAIRNLAKAGAMVAAEIDRRLRAGERE